MEAGGSYSEHSLAQHSAGSYGLPLLERALADVRTLPPPDGPVVVADLGAAGGRNELEPMAVAVRGLRAGGLTVPIVVVHTDIPTNDFTALFETIDAPGTYLAEPDVYAYAAGRSFYERLFPADSLIVGWSAIAVHWLSRVPTPIPDHVYCAFATGAARDALVRQSAADWQHFLSTRAVELRAGGQVVVVGGACTDDGTSGAEELTGALDTALRDAVAGGALTADEYAQMTVPTWNRTMAEFTAPFAEHGSATAAGLDLLEHSLVEVPDSYLPAYRESGDAGTFADSVSGFLRAFTEPSLIETLERPAGERAAIAARVYDAVRDRIAADPTRYETIWRVALLRVARRA
jgi:hypothetical protein